MNADRDYRRILLIIFTLTAICYAFLAGLRTVADFDVGWQLAIGRYVAQHHAIPAGDTFSYTATGKEFLYPPFAGLLLYAVFQSGGYAGLSWLCAIAAVATVALLVRRSSCVTSALCVLAVPAIAYRTGPRADLFTTVFFAFFLDRLWRFQQSNEQQSKERLWPLPLLMLFWVNLHPGFVAGVAAIAAYLAMEASDLCFAGRRARAIQRLRRAWPWLLFSILVTLINPWGPRIYPAMLRQTHSADVPFIGEWSAVPLSWRALRHALELRDPESSFWLLALVAILAIAIALRRRHFVLALTLAGAIYLAFGHLRYQGLFAVSVVVLAGGLLTDAVDQPASFALPGKLALGHRSHGPVVVLSAVLVLVTCLRIADLTSNRYYLASSSTSLFGPGESWWFPERAASFIEHQHLPGNIFHDYTMGGFVAWRLGPRYLDYIDGRDVPFAPDVFLEEQRTLAAAPDSPQWQADADRRQINVLLFSLARFGGLGQIDLQAFCRSANWRPVYLDEVSVIFVRNRPENRPWLDPLTLDCYTQPFTPPPRLSRAGLFSFYANAASVAFVLGRDREAQQFLDRAEALYPDDPGIHLVRAQLLQQHNFVVQAEQEYRAAISERETDVGWFALGRLYASQGRLPEAAQAMRNSAALAARPHNSYKLLGQIELAMGQPERALRAFARADRLSPFHGPMEPLGNEFYAQLEEGRAEACRQLGRLAEAIAWQQQVVKRNGQSGLRWRRLAELYQAHGDTAAAQQAAERARQLALGQGQP